MSQCQRVVVGSAATGSEGGGPGLMAVGLMESCTSHIIDKAQNPQAVPVTWPSFAELTCG